MVGLIKRDFFIYRNIDIALVYPPTKLFPVGQVSFWNNPFDYK